MNLFGWFTVFIWAYGTATVNNQSGKHMVQAKLFCLFMLIGTLVWGTGAL